jgi:ribosomal protein S18 acetylase RimI-like enzyme
LDSLRIAEAAAVLARAFHNDPLQSYVFPDEEQRSALSPAHFEPFVRFGHLAAEVWTVGNPIGGVAVWCPPAGGSIDDALLEQAGFSRLPVLIGEEPWRRFNQMLQHVDPFRHADVPGPHWYLMVIGVDPSRKGAGLGGALLKHGIENADADGVPCYLETCQPENVGFYRNHGFAMLRHGIEPESGLGYWTFLRQPSKELKSPPG